jgi:hypothetical protein
LPRLEWEVVDNPEPDPEVEALLEYMGWLGRLADTCAFYIGPADGGTVAD